jgi:hypothetical protein
MHQKLGRRTLHFWFVRLEGHYEKDETFATLVNCMEEAGAVAYAGYELSGEFDLMLRVWLPSGEVARFKELLGERVRVKLDRGYPVDEVIRHWVWEDNGDHAVAPCKMESLNRSTLLGDIDALNRLSESSHDTGEVLAKNSEELERLERFIDACAIRSVASDSGIRLVLRLRPDPDIPNPDQKRVVEQIAMELDRLRFSGRRSERERSSKLAIREFSLYNCSSGTLIALCRIDYLAWHKIREQLITPLGRISGLAQTTTFPALSPTLEVSRETLLLPEEVRKKYVEPHVPRRFIPESLQKERFKPVDNPPDPSEFSEPPPGMLPVRELLDREEASDFEAKGSAFSALEDWLDRGVNAPDEAGLEESRDYFCKTVVKAIVAMLNTEGGVILIGALERDHYAKDNRERLRLRIENFPCEGRFRLLGLQDPIFRRGRWDNFDRKFNELLVGMVDGTIGRRVALLPGWHNEKNFALVRVHGPGNGFPSKPFYLVKGGKKEFYIRRGGMSEELTGTAIHDYRADQP